MKEELIKTLEQLEQGEKYTVVYYDFLGTFQTRNIIVDKVVDHRSAFKINGEKTGGRLYLKDNTSFFIAEGWHHMDFSSLYIEGEEGNDYKKHLYCSNEWIKLAHKQVPKDKIITEQEGVIKWLS